MNDKTDNKPEAYDPFDPARLRLQGDSLIGVERVITAIPCRKPNKHQFFRVHPDDDYRLQTGIFVDQLNRESYLVSPNLWPDLAGEVEPTILFACVDRAGSVFLWPCKIPDSARPSAWHTSAIAAANLATTDWVRVGANMQGGSYDVRRATGTLPEPQWPEMTFREMLKVCFADRFIEALDHPILQQLRGEV